MFQYLNRKYGITREILAAYKDQLNLHFLPWKLDKGQHLVLGFLLFCIFCAVQLGAFWALVSVVIIAVVKEVYDFFHPNHNADAWDAIATVFLPSLIYLLFFL